MPHLKQALPKYRHLCYLVIKAWYQMVWYGMVQMIQYVMVCYGMLWYVMVCYGMLWYVMVCYGMLWYVMVCYGKVS